MGPLKSVAEVTKHDSGGKMAWNKKDLGTFLVAQMVKCLSTMRETWVRSLGWEESLEKETATHSSTVASKIP